MKIVITEEQKNNLFKPRNLDRWEKWNSEQPEKDGIKINQYDEDGDKTGRWISISVYGKPYMEKNYLNGSQHGPFKFYDSVGNLLEKGQYIHGSRDGVFYFYDSKFGGEDYSVLYKDGHAMKKTKLGEGVTLDSTLLLTEDSISDYFNNTLDRVKNLPYETKKQIITYTLTAMLGYGSHSVINNIVKSSNTDKETKEIVSQVLNRKKDVEHFKNALSLRLSKQGVDNIKNEEKPKLRAYNIGDGMITIGYGHAEPISNSKYREGDKIDINTANKLLMNDLTVAANGVRRMFRDWEKEGVNIKITQDMFDVLCSFAFNSGVSKLRQTQLVKELKKGNYQIAGKMLRQTNISDSFPGLEDRRERESNMFLSYLNKTNNSERSS